MPEIGRWTGAAARAAAEVLLAASLLYTVAVVSVPDGMPLWWLAMLAVCYLAGFACAHFGSMLHRSLVSIIAVIFAAVLFLALLPIDSAGTWIGAVCGLVLFFRGHRSAGSLWSTVFPISAMWICVALYVPAAVVFRVAESLHPYAGTLFRLGMAALFVAVFAANDSRLRRESGGKSGNKAPAAIRRVNRFYTLLIFALIMLAGSFGDIRDWFSDRLSALMRLLSRLFSSGGGMKDDLDLDGSTGPFKMPFENEGGDAAWMEWFVKIVFILAAAAFFIFICFILFRFGKRLYGWLAMLVRWLTGNGGGEAGGAEADYEDEKENLLDLKELRDGLTGRLRSMLGRRGRREPSWSELRDNRERVRYLYRLFVRRGMNRGYEFKPHFTPLETGEDLAKWERGETGKLLGGLGKLYSRAKYADGRENIPADDVDALYRASQQS